MRLNEIFNEDTVTPAGVENLEKVLDKNFYQPDAAVKTDKPVLDMEFSKNPSSHFIQRFNQRSDIGKFSLVDVGRLLAQAKTDPSLGFKDELDALSKENYPMDDVILQAKGPNPLTIPVIIKPNPAATKMTDGRPVAADRAGNKIPKNQIIPKTVYRKGIDD